MITDESDNPTALHETEAEEGGQSKTDLQREYWNRMANVIDDKGYRIWEVGSLSLVTHSTQIQKNSSDHLLPSQAVHASMEKYNTTLSDRHALLQEVTSIRLQNDELKSLLRRYMAAKVNEELQVPPTQIMLAQAGMLQGEGGGTRGGTGRVRVG